MSFKNWQSGLLMLIVNRLLMVCDEKKSPHFLNFFIFSTILAVRNEKRK